VSIYKHAMLALGSVLLLHCKSGLLDARPTAKSESTTGQARPDDAGKEPDWFNKPPVIKEPDWFQSGAKFTEANLQNPTGIERLNLEELAIQSCAFVDRAGGFPAGAILSPEEAAKLKGKHLYLSFDSKSPRDANTGSLAVLIADDTPPREGTTITIDDRSHEGASSQWVSYATSINGQSHEFLTTVTSSTCSLSFAKSESVDSGLSGTDPDTKTAAQLYKMFLAGTLTCNFATKPRDGEAAGDTLALKAAFGCSGFYLRTP